MRLTLLVLGPLLLAGGLVLLVLALRRRPHPAADPIAPRPVDPLAKTQLVPRRPVDGNWVRAGLTLGDASGRVPLIAGSGTCGVLGVALLITGALLPAPEPGAGSGSGPDRAAGGGRIELPQRAGGLDRIDDQGNFQEFKQALWADHAGLARDVVRASRYGKQGLLVVEFTGAVVPDAQRAQRDQLFAKITQYEFGRLSLNGYLKVSVQDIPADPYPGRLRCAELTTGTGSACVWLDERTIGSVNAHDMPLATLRELLPRFRADVTG